MSVQSYNKMLIYLHFYPEFYLRISAKGGKADAFGARIRMKCAKVGAICPTLTGVWMTAGRTSHPIKIKGAEV